MGLFNRSPKMSQQSSSYQTNALPMPKIKNKKGPCNDDQLSGYVPVLFKAARDARSYIPTFNVGNVTDLIVKNNRAGEVIVELWDIGGDDAHSAMTGTCSFIYNDDGSLDYISLDYDPIDGHGYSLTWSKGSLHKVSIII